MDDREQSSLGADGWSGGDNAKSGTAGWDNVTRWDQVTEKMLQPPEIGAVGTFGGLVNSLDTISRFRNWQAEMKNNNNNLLATKNSVDINDMVGNTNRSNRSASLTMTARNEFLADADIGQSTVDLPPVLITNEELAAIHDPLGKLSDSEVRNKLLAFQNNPIPIYERLKEHNSPNLLRESFDPATFLISVHNTTEYEQLRKGLENIESVVQDQTLKMKELVTDHFHEFVQCKETIDNIHLMVTNTGNKSEESRKLIDQTSQMLEEMKHIETQANQLYGPLLTRTREAQRIQSTISSMKQPYSQFIFTLPQLIKHNVMMRNFDQVVRLYRRAKNLKKQVHFSKNVVFKEIMSQVDRTISLLRGSLFDQLKQSDTLSEEEDRIIHYLMELDSKEDPALYLLNEHYQKISKMMEQCVQEHETTVRSLEKNPNSRLGPTDLSTPDNSQKKMAKRMCHIFTTYMPAFWKFGKAIIDGRFKKEDAAKDEVGRSLSLKRRNVRRVRELFDRLATQFSEHIKAAFDDMSTLKPTSRVHAGSIANLMVQLDDHIRFNEVVKDNVTYLLNSYRALKSVNVQQDYLRQIDHLMSSITREYLHKLFQSTLRAVSNLREHEKWIPHKDIPVITNLPFEFEKIIERTLTTIESIGIDVLYDADDQYRDREETLGDADDYDREYSPTPEKNQENPAFYEFHKQQMGDDPDNTGQENTEKKNKEKASTTQSNQTNVKTVETYEYNSKWLIPQVGCFFVESLKIFADVLHHFVFLTAEPSANMSSEKTKSPHEEFDLPWSEISINSEADTPESHDRRLLAVLSNAMYTKDVILERLWSRVMYSGRIIAEEYQQIIETEKDSVNELYVTLEEIIFDYYVRSKTLKFNRILDESLLCDGINWEMAPEPRGIRNHCLQLLLEIVFVHNEVYNRAKQELKSVLEGLVRKIADHLLATIESIDRFSPNGAMQVLVEVEFIRKTLRQFLLPISRHVFNQIKKLLSDCIAQDRAMIKQKVDKLISSTEQSTIVMFSCFRESTQENREDSAEA